MTPINNYLTQKERRIGLSENLSKPSRQSSTQPLRSTRQGGLMSRLVRALVAKDSRSYASTPTSTQSVPGEVI